MICAIMQPTYIPWIGYFDLIDKVDTFIFYDDVQLTKRSWQVRNRLKGTNNEIWLTVPIKKIKSRNETLIKDAKINYEDNWISKHLKTIEYNYKKSMYFDEIFQFIQNHYIQYNSLSEFNSKLIINISKKIGITTKFIYSSELSEITGSKDKRLVNICKRIEANQYLSPQGSADYINEKNQGGEFVLNNIDLFYHNYQHPEYNQLYNNFIPFMGIYDLLFNEGFNNALQIIKSGRKNNILYKNLV